MVSLVFVRTVPPVHLNTDNPDIIMALKPETLILLNFNFTVGLLLLEVPITIPLLLEPSILLRFRL